MRPPVPEAQLGPQLSGAALTGMEQKLPMGSVWECLSSGLILSDLLQSKLSIAAQVFKPSTKKVEAGGL